MKKISKICLSLLLINLIALMVIVPVDVFASNAKFSSFGATYQIKEVVDEYDFGYGITYQREISTIALKNQPKYNKQDCHEAAPRGEGALIGS